MSAGDAAGWCRGLHRSRNRARGSFWVSEASERSHVDVMQDLMIGCKQLLK